MFNTYIVFPQRFHDSNETGVTGTGVTCAWCDICLGLVWHMPGCCQHTDELKLQEKKEFGPNQRCRWHYKRGLTTRDPGCQCDHRPVIPCEPNM